MAERERHEDLHGQVQAVRSTLDAIESTLALQSAELARRDLLRDLLEITVGAPAEQGMILDFALTYAMETGALAESGSIFVTVPDGPKESLRLLFKNLLTVEGRLQRVSEADEFESFEKGDGFAGYVLASGEAVYSNDPPSDPRYSAFTQAPQLKSLACVPVKCGTAVLAVVSIHNRRTERPFSEEDVAFLGDLARISALCIRAYHNDLTLLPSRPLMDELLRREVARADQDNRSLTLAYLDLDEFGKVNRKYKHDYADQVITEFATLLREESGYNTTLCHRHGDEFAIIFRDENLDQARVACERIRESVEARSFTISRPKRKVARIELTASMGVAAWQRPMTFTDLIDRADEASQAAKAAGRNRVECR